MIGYQENCLADGKLEAEIEPMLAGNPEPAKVVERFGQRFGVKLDEQEVEASPTRRGRRRAGTAPPAEAVTAKHGRRRGRAARR